MATSLRTGAAGGFEVAAGFVMGFLRALWGLFAFDMDDPALSRVMPTAQVVAEQAPHVSTDALGESQVPRRRLALNGHTRCRIAGIDRVRSQGFPFAQGLRDTGRHWFSESQQLAQIVCLSEVYLMANQ